MTGPEDAAAAGPDRLRASHADREQVIETLKDAFVHGRLAKDEFDARAGRALAARTCADLGALTADIPPGLTSRPPARPPAATRRRSQVRAAVGSGSCLVVAGAAVWTAFLLDPGPFASPGPGAPAVSPGLLLVLAALAVFAALGFVWYGVATSVKQRRTRGQLPPRPGAAGHAPGGERHGPVPPGPRTDQRRADLQVHKSRRRRRHIPARAGHGVRSAPGAA